jgi:hypothetical protein
LRTRDALHRFVMMHWHNQSARWLMGMTMTLLLAGMTACGVTPTSATTGAASGSSSTTKSSPTATATGCPLPTQTVQWPQASSQVATLGTATTQSSSPVQLGKGQTLEVHMPFGHVWGLAVTSLSSIMRVDAPAGYGDAASKTCVWHFTALSSGSVTLDFTERALCPPNVGKCPQYAALVDLLVTVN